MIYPATQLVSGFQTPQATQGNGQRYPAVQILVGARGAVVPVVPVVPAKVYPVIHFLTGLLPVRAVTLQIDEPFEVSLCTYLNEKLPSRIFPNHVPEKVSLPGYTYECLDEDPYFLLSGERVGVTSAIYQIDCLSSSSSESVKLQVALRDCLHGFHGSLMGATFVQVARLQNRSSTHYDPSPVGSDKGIYTISCEYKFLYRDPIARNR